MHRIFLNASEWAEDSHMQDRIYMRNCQQVHSNYEHMLWDSEMVEDFFLNFLPEVTELFQRYPAVADKGEACPPFNSS